MDRQLPADVAGSGLAANSRLSQLAVPVLDSLRRVVGGWLSVALHRHLPPSVTLCTAAALVAKLPAPGCIDRTMVVSGAADIRPASARSALCWLLEFSIAEVAALPSRLFQPRSLGGNEL